MPDDGAEGLQTVEQGLDCLLADLAKDEKLHNHTIYAGRRMRKVVNMVGCAELLTDDGEEE